jgi:alkanesulfonate monooxygenase SsuD/methylene tetrahydromethanopterin reductase-like flavin-dependent oxidoreductase (luciferase family)
MRPYFALYLGGMGARDTNYHADVFRRMGYGDIINDVTKLFRGGHKDQAATAIPDELLDDAAIIGDIDQVRRQIRRWRASGVTMLIVNADTNEQVQRYASLL